MKGLGTSNQLQSILTLIVQTIVSAVLGTFSEQQQGALKVSLRAFSVIHRTSLMFWNNLLLCHIAFEFKVSCEA